MTFHADDDIERVIYCVFCFDESVYIGRTKNIKQRMVQHQHPPFWAILETVKGFLKACEREDFWKEYYESRGAHVLNRYKPRRVPDSSPRPLKQFAELKEMIAKHGKSDECLLWPHSRMSQDGYGQVPVGNGRARSAHRVAYEHTHPGEVIPEGMDVMHAEHCPNKHCFNPNHLSIGTRQDNVDTAVKLGHVRGCDGKTTGEKNGRATLTEAEVIHIRAMNASGKGHRKIAREVGRSRTLIQRIVQRKLWAHLPPVQI